MNRKILGHLLLLLGLGLPLLASYLVWQSLAPDYGGYQAYLQGLDPAQDLVDKIRISEYNNKLEGTFTNFVDPFSADRYNLDYQVLGDQDQPLAYLSLPDLGILQPIYLGASADHMQEGLAHLAGTAIPNGQAQTHAVIVGHRAYEFSLPFLFLGSTPKDAWVTIQRGLDQYHYQVIGREVIQPSDKSSFVAGEGEELLTLMTAEPLAPPRTQRLLIHCRRIPPDELATMDIPTLEGRSPIPAYRPLAILKISLIFILLLSGFFFALVLGRLVKLWQLAKKTKR